MDRKEIKLAIIGGDMRQQYTAKYFSFLCECAVYALAGDIGNAVRCTDLESAVKEASAIILPLPASTNGETVNTATAPNKQIYLKDTANLLKNDATVIGGKLPLAFSEYCSSLGIKTYDYFESDALQIKNALPTAEGALELLIRETPTTVCGSNILIFGFGRVGRATAKILTSVGAHVTVAARSASDIALASCSGCSTLNIRSLNLEEGIKATAWNAVINTVPAPIITLSMLNCMPKGIPLIELASGDGGTTEECSKQAGIRLIKAPALPGKTAPETAAKIIIESISDYLKEVGIL